MARLLIEGGPLSYERLASNAAADRVLTAAALELGYSGPTTDKQAVLDFVGDHLVEHLRELAQAQEEAAARLAAAEQVRQNRPEWL